VKEKLSEEDIALMTIGTDVFNNNLDPNQIKTIWAMGMAAFRAASRRGYVKKERKCTSKT